ncbi:MAG: hypothetical protein PHV68_05050 [Candidatus Gastranaerophilales bacterium]|nr:hypothetical protein [Candidatus Gastranaerophilales bacterium]
MSMINNYTSQYFSLNSNSKPIAKELKVKELKGEIKGHLVKENFVQSIAHSATEPVRNAKYFANALKGEGNDYTVGKIHDLTLMLGGLGIAAVLQSNYVKPVNKVMEFVGFSSFFGAMAIWPKMIINPLVNAVKGVDMNQEYVDSSGKRKPFYQDSQYLPWDLMDDKQINKMGDKLGVPENIKDRKKHIQEKAKQVATQTNTLWMLTAGIATPVISSLMANYIQRPVRDITEAVRVKNAAKEAGLKNIDELLNVGNNPYKKIVVNPIASLLSAVKPSKKAPATIDEHIIAFEKAYDALLGKDLNPADEYNFKRFVSGINKPIKNADGISVVGDEWAKVPNKIIKALKIDKKLLTAISINQNAHTRTQILTEHLMNTFGNNDDALKEAVKKCVEAIDKPIQKTDVAATILKEKAGEIVASLKEEIAKAPEGQEKELLKNKLEFIAEQQINGKRFKIADNNRIAIETFGRIDNKVLDTKSSWYSVFNVLDAVTANNKNDVTNLVKGFGVDNLYNEPELYKTRFSNMGGKMQFIFNELNMQNQLEKINMHNKMVHSEISKFIGYNNGEKIHNNVSEATTKWVGKTFNEFVRDAANETRFYKGWIKPVAGIGIALLGVTALAITQFGKTNRFNKDVYEVKE